MTGNEGSGTGTNLGGLRVVELADEQAEYCGQLLAGLGADVIKVEPPDGSPTRRIGPFFEDIEDPERSLFFWQYNRGKRSVVIDTTASGGRQQLHDLVATADVLLDSTPRGHLAAMGLGTEILTTQLPALVIARMSAFGDTGPWADFTGSDLVHLALGGPMMNCGYDPQPDGMYDLPPIAPQVWHAYHVAGEQLTMAIIAALIYRRRTGSGQVLSCAVHEAVAKNTELDLMNWVMRRAPLFRQTCRHAAEAPSLVPGISQTKDGRWFMMSALGGRDRAKLVDFLSGYGMAGDLPERLQSAGGLAPEVNARLIPGSGADSEMNAHVTEVVGRWIRKYTYDNMPWREAQEAGLLCVPLRKPHENIADRHWQRRATFSDVEHPELGRSFTYVTSKWVSDEAPWTVGRRAPLLNEDGASVAAEVAARRAGSEKIAGDDDRPSDPSSVTSRLSRRGQPFALDGIRILDFTWFLASAGGTRFLAAMGAESIKVEWSAHPDTRMGAMAPVGGRAARDAATAPLPGVNDTDMGGQFNNKNAGKRGISLNVRHPRGLEIARELVRMSDIVAEGFSPGVMDGWGLGYEQLRELRPDIIYAQQSGMGSAGTYGRFRAVGPIAASIAGTSEMSGLPEPAMPAGWGYSYLDWIGAYSFATAMLAALEYRGRTGRGQWIDASQCETGIYLAGPAVLDWSAHGRPFVRTGNRSPHKPAAPHGAYRCRGTDRWIAIACFTEEQWAALGEVAEHLEWMDDARFTTMTERLRNQDALDALVTSWTDKQDPYDAMERLQGAGVPAGVCQTAQDRCEHDPQLVERSWLTEVTGTKIGTWPLAEVPVAMSVTPTYIGGPIDRGAPCYGEDNEYVYGELLGMSSKEIGTLADAGVI